MIDIIFTRPLTIYNSSETRNSAFTFKERTKPLRSPQLVKLNSFNFDWKRCSTSKGFRALFVYCMITFFRFSLKLCSFLSLFSSDSQLCVVEFLIKQLFYSGLPGQEMIITNLALRASLVIYHFISSVPS